MEILPRLSFPRLVLAAILLSSLVVLPQELTAGSATWRAAATSGLWNSPNNWSPRVVPDSPTDTATFNVSSQTSISFTQQIQVSQITFNAGASSFTITPAPTYFLEFDGPGILNLSGATQQFVSAADSSGHGAIISFFGGSLAGSSTTFVADGGLNSGFLGGGLEFHDSASADHGLFTIDGGAADNAAGGFMQFFNSASAGSGAFICNASIPTATGGGFINFLDESTAASADFTVNGAPDYPASSGFIQFLANSTADHATFFTGPGAQSDGAGGVVFFRGTSTAADGVFTNEGSAFGPNGLGGRSWFFDTATAARGVFTNTGGKASGAYGGEAVFFDCSTAETATITAMGGTAFGARFGFVQFNDASTAANSTLIAEGGAAGGAAGGGIFFAGTATGGEATLIAQDGAPAGAAGGTVFFYEGSTGGAARLELLGNSSLDISFHDDPGAAVGSLEGAGTVNLGSHELVVGSNNLDTTFSGLLQDGGLLGGDHGSLTKIGTGTLTLSGASRYTGGTTISNGWLFVTNRSGSATGTGPVQVSGGILGGTGRITGTVTVGSGTGLTGQLAPGVDRPARLTIKSSLKFNFDGQYNCDLFFGKQLVDQVAANGVTISGGSGFFLFGTGMRRLPLGTAFTVINNTSENPISGTFTNLNDGGVINAGGNNLQADYEGGDGNDLTLTVVP